MCIRDSFERYRKGLGERLAESWELSTHTDGHSRLSDGRTLQDRLAMEPWLAGGSAHQDGTIPILAKLIDARLPLSVQVHPDEDGARRHGELSGKTECWYILDADPDAWIYYGLRKSLTRTELEQHVREGTIESVLRKVPVHAGDVFFIPAGTLHALSGGILLSLIHIFLQSLWTMIENRRTTVNGRIIVGGRGRRDPESADIFTRIAMDVAHSCRYVEPQFTLRFDRETPEDIIDAALDAIGSGATYPTLYNDDVHIPAVMRAMRVDEKTAEQYVPFGCGEFVIQGQSVGTPNICINLLKILQIALNNGVDPMDGIDKSDGVPLLPAEEIGSFDVLFSQYKRLLDHYFDLSIDSQLLSYEVMNQEVSFLFTSILMDDCIERGKAVLDGGIRYLGGTVETYGNINVSDSLSLIHISLKNGLIVSCQVQDDDPISTPDMHVKMAEAAAWGGAVGIRANSPSQIRDIKAAVDLPVIGLYKQWHEGSNVFITSTFDAVREVYEAGAEIIALDCTDQLTAEGRPAWELLPKAIKAFPDAIFFADISNYEEAARAIELGADMVAPTLYGYTQETWDIEHFNAREFARMCRDFGDDTYMIIDVYKRQAHHRALG